MCSESYNAHLLKNSHPRFGGTVWNATEANMNVRIGSGKYLGGAAAATFHRSRIPKKPLTARTKMPTRRREELAKGVERFGGTEVILGPGTC